MPLVVPGVTADNMGDDKAQEWMSKLAGKTLSEGPSSETVSRTDLSAIPCHGEAGANSSSPQTFCKTDLPQETRVIEPGMMVTKDFKPDRRNVHVKEDGTVSHVSQG